MKTEAEGRVGQPGGRQPAVTGLGSLLYPAEGMISQWSLDFGLDLQTVREKIKFALFYLFYL